MNGPPCGFQVFCAHALTLCPKHGRRTPGLRGATGGPVQRERSGTAVIAHPASIEAEIDRTAGGNRTIVTEIGNADLLTRLAIGAIPELRNLLISWECERKHPVIDGDSTEISNNDIHVETSGPLALQLVAHMTRTQRSSRGDLRRRRGLHGWGCLRSR